jgi:serine protease Do
MLQRARRPQATTPHPLAETRRNAIVRAVERSRLSVVTVRVTGPPRLPTALERLFFYPFDTSGPTHEQWWGSGFVVDPAGYILTNEHVVRGAHEVVVSIGDERRGGSFPAEVVGTAPEFDLALLRLPAVSRPGGLLGDGEPIVVPVTVGDSDDLMVGEWAIAIGSPFGSQLATTTPSVSVGVISALRRDVPPPDDAQVRWPYFKMIQTDAIINEGNSGGPLVNAAGEVVGINTIKLASSNRVNFSIPINTAQWVWRELRDYGVVRRPWIGWELEELDPALRAQWQLPEEEGVLTVRRVEPGSPAADGGVQPGDILLSLQGWSAYSRARAERILFGLPVGGRVEVELLRGGQLRRVLLQLREDPTARADREARSNTRRDRNDSRSAAP